MTGSSNAELLRSANIRLCRLCVWPNFDGLGFNLEASDRPPHIIRLVESNSPAAAGGLKILDVVLAVNQQDVSNADYNQVKNAIKAARDSNDPIELRVIEQRAYQALKKKGISMDSLKPTVIETPIAMPNDYYNFSKHQPRTCNIRLNQSDTFGFEVVSGENDVGAFIQEVSPNTPASNTPLRKSDRIIKIDDKFVDKDVTKSILEKLTTAKEKGAVKLYVVDTKTYKYYQIHQIPFTDSSVILPPIRHTSVKPMSDQKEIQIPPKTYQPSRPTSKESSNRPYLYTNDDSNNLSRRSTPTILTTCETDKMTNVSNGTIEVCRGDITKHMVDAIVIASTSDSLRENILQEAGFFIKTTYDNENRQQLNKTICTNGGNLACKRIYFIPCPQMSRNADKWTFRNFVSEAIEMATNDSFTNIQSIAFPAIGCGQYGCDSNFVANTLIMAVAYELEQRPFLRLHVYFIIQQHEQEIFDAFQNELTALKNSNESRNRISELSNVSMNLSTNISRYQENRNGFATEKRRLHNLNEYNMVLNQFLSTMTTDCCSEILRIELIWNERWYKQYMIHKEEFSQRLQYDSEAYLFHGCSEDAANSIIKECFNRSYAGEHGTMYGYGVYFSSKASYSHSYTTPNSNGERCMFLAKVLIGRTIIGDSSMKTCPAGYDTTTDGSHIYVIYHDAQAFGYYLITYI